MTDYNEGGLILIDKPLGKTSFQAVKLIKHLAKVKKVGHAGTLDPLATGLLIICTGKWTKKITALQLEEKEYTGTFVLGATRPSYDMETEIDQTCDLSNFDAQSILQTVPAFVGTIQQTPPIYSAIKVDGKRAYESARAGTEITLKSREVQVSQFEITRVALPEMDFRIVCSKGTYIRSIAHDFGQKLGVGAYLSALRRTRIGDYSIDDALTFDQLKDQFEK